MNLRGPALARDERRLDGPTGTRGKCLGIGGADFAVLAPLLDIESEEGCQEWAAGHCAYACLLRGGELGRPDVLKHALDLRRVICIDCVQEQPPHAASRGFPWLYVWVCAIKHG